jgi:hypothetical protein
MIHAALFVGPDGFELELPDDTVEATIALKAFDAFTSGPPDPVEYTSPGARFRFVVDRGVGMIGGRL